MSPRYSTDMEEIGDLVAYKIETARFLRYGAIIEVKSVEQALMAEAAQASAVCVCYFGEPDSNIWVALSSLIRDIQSAVNIPIIAQIPSIRSAEVSFLEGLDVDMVHELENNHYASSVTEEDRRSFPIPVVCASSSLWPLLRCFAAGASLVCTQKEDSLMATIAQLRLIKRELQKLMSLSSEDIESFAETLDLDPAVLQPIRSRGVLPVPLFARGNILSVTDVYLAMSHGAEGVFVDNAVFASTGGETAEAVTARLREIVTATSCGCDIDRLWESCPDFVDNCLQLKSTD